MRVIDLQTWDRRAHFNKFMNFDQPHFNMCANMDVTVFYPFLKGRGYSFNIAIVYIISRAANAIPHFRYRIRGSSVVEHERVDPSVTVLIEGDLFSFCMIEYTEEFSVFASQAEEKIAYVKEHPTLSDEPGRDDLLFMSSIPWVSFTSFMHPIPTHPPDSVPRFAWGKRFEEGASLKMPLGVQAHHALMDGIHMGWFYEQVQEYLSDPLSIFAR